MGPHETKMTAQQARLEAIYRRITGETPPPNLVGELAREPILRREIVRLACEGRGTREIGATLGISHGAAGSRLRAVILAARKRALGLPRYYRVGRKKK